MTNFGWGVNPPNNLFERASTKKNCNGIRLTELTNSRSKLLAINLKSHHLSKEREQTKCQPTTFQCVCIKGYLKFQLINCLALLLISLRFT